MHPRTWRTSSMDLPSRLVLPRVAANILVRSRLAHVTPPLLLHLILRNRHSSGARHAANRDHIDARYDHEFEAAAPCSPASIRASFTLLHGLDV